MLNKNNKELTGKIDEIIELYNKESDEISDKVNELEEYWEDYYICISFVAHLPRLMIFHIRLQSCFHFMNRILMNLFLSAKA